MQSISQCPNINCSWMLTAADCSGLVDYCSWMFTAADCSGLVDYCSWMFTAADCSGLVDYCSLKFTAADCSGLVGLSTGLVLARNRTNSSTIYKTCPYV